MNIYNNIIPFPGFKCINLFGILFIRKDASPMTDIDFNHEGIHTVQCWEMLGIPFYIWYCIEYLFRLFQYGSHEAYYNISFEREAYTNQGDLDYLNKRKFWAFLKYL